jgi:uncharacterized protein (TIGR02421 family)
MSEADLNAAFAAVIAVVRDRLSRNLRIRRNLPGDGRLRIDRQLPFLCVYRQPPEGRDNGTRELVTTEAAYLVASGERRYEAGVNELCRSISETLEEHFGALLLVELWAEDDRAAPEAARELARPRFRIVAEPQASLRPTATALEAALREIRLHNLQADVELTFAEAPAPPGIGPIAADCTHGDCHRIGVAVRPAYRDHRSGALFPLVLQSLRRQLAAALRKAFFAFAGAPANSPRRHYESFGPSIMAKAGRLVDQQLCEVAQSFDFLLQVTPVNAEAAWEEFVSGGRRAQPRFYYRPLPYHPSLLKRRLYESPLEHVEDATLAHLFEQKQDELDNQLAALKHIDSPAFYYDSLRLYGAPDDELVELAEAILRRADDDPEESEVALVTPERIVQAAREHVDYYHERLPDFHATVQQVDHIASALMVAQDKLYVSQTAVLREQRLDPLLQHEVGAHLLTYFNGRQQPLRQLCAGFARYEALQEGLAVLSEYLVGGLTAGRMRTLAGRVLAVRSLCEGASFAATFELLHEGRRLQAKTAFMTALRVYRGGGLTKDALYLHGLRELLGYLHQGHDLEPLYVGKIALEHVPLVQELRRRGVVHPPALLPRFWEDPAFHARLARCRQTSVLDLLETTP